MHLDSRLAPLVLALALATGCATTTVSNRQMAPADLRLARPDRIIVHNFATSADEVPAESGLAGQAEAPSKPLTSEEMAADRELGEAVAKELVSKIKEMGLPAVQALGEPPPRVNDIVIRGAFLSVDEGSAVQRVVIGFGYGAPQLKTYVEGYVMTERGLRRLGSGDVDAGGGKSPGVAIPLVVVIATANPIGLIVGGAVKGAGEITGSSKLEGAGKRTAEEIAKELRPRFEQQGWITPEN